MNWKQIGVIAAALVALIAIASAAKPFIQSDPPPYANINRVKATGDDVTAYVIRGNILGRWSAKCEASRSGNNALALTIDEQISGLQDDYARLTGLQFPLRRCP